MVVVAVVAIDKVVLFTKVLFPNKLKETAITHQQYDILFFIR